MAWPPLRNLGQIVWAQKRWAKTFFWPKTELNLSENLFFFFGLHLILGRKTDLVLDWKIFILIFINLKFFGLPSPLFENFAYATEYGLDFFTFFGSCQFRACVFGFRPDLVSPFHLMVLTKKIVTKPTSYNYYLDWGSITGKFADTLERLPLNHSQRQCLGRKNGNLDIHRLLQKMSTKFKN